jgi:signal transduction histidine kinase
MRNPLTAVLQSVDDVQSVLGKYLSPQEPLEVTHDVVKSVLDAVNIISLCAQHQGRVINDVLTLSKLDASMLRVNPVHTRPITVVEDMMTILNRELRAHDVTLDWKITHSYQILAIRRVLIDPSRLSQVWI